MDSKKCPKCGAIITEEMIEANMCWECGFILNPELADDDLNEIVSNQYDDLAKQKAMSSMLVTSGFSFDGYTITKYSGYISGDDVIQVNRGYSGWVNGATDAGKALTDSLVKIRRQALIELKEAAYELGCNAVIGVDFDYITLEPETANVLGGTTYLPYVFCVTANGNAVVIEKNPPSVSSVLKEYKEMLDCGIITPQEFETKKKELL